MSPFHEVSNNDVEKYIFPKPERKLRAIPLRAGPSRDREAEGPVGLPLMWIVDDLHFESMQLQSLRLIGGEASSGTSRACA